MVFEGLVIQRVPYKERDLIAKLILRNGTLGSFYVYGGQGGGKNQKPTIYELGSMLRVMIRDKGAKSIEGSQLMIAAESARLWEPQRIRHNIQAFYLVCLYFEVIQKFSVAFHPSESDYTNDEHEGIFSVVSNAIFYLDESLRREDFDPAQHLGLFMVKLLFHLGIMPDTSTCGYCGSDLLQKPGVSFLPGQGQFACLDCVSAEDEKGFLLRVKKGYQTRFQDYKLLTGATFSEADKLIQYFCHHFHLRPVELKSYRLLFK